MKARFHVRMALTVGMLTAFALLALVLPLGAQVDNQDYGGGGGTGNCNYCSLATCGCPSPPPGTILDYSCGRSSTYCTRSCTYR
jgi:hypothetical protein